MKKSPSKTKTSTSTKPSKETMAAIKIQKIARGFLAKKKLALKKKEKQEYNKLIENLQKQVISNMVSWIKLYDINVWV